MDPTTMEENTSFLAKSYAPCGTDNEGRGIMWITGSTYTILYIYLRRYILHTSMEYIHVTSRVYIATTSPYVCACLAVVVGGRC